MLIGVAGVSLESRLLWSSTTLGSAACCCSRGQALLEFSFEARHTDLKIWCDVFLAGRHPLCELLVPGTFIDNDTTLGALAAAGADSSIRALHPRMLLITGPNASGKSVYMKQVCVDRFGCIWEGGR